MASSKKGEERKRKKENPGARAGQTPDMETKLKSEEGNIIIAAVTSLSIK